MRRGGRVGGERRGRLEDRMVRKGEVGFVVKGRDGMGKEGGRCECR